jgi:phosphatidylinositol dimannoside acyltransferase
MIAKPKYFFCIFIDNVAAMLVLSAARRPAGHLDQKVVAFVCSDDDPAGGSCRRDAPPGRQRRGRRVMTLREHAVSAAYRFGWLVVRRVPESWARWVFRQIADALWRRQGKGVRQLEANLRRVVPGRTGEQLRQLSRAGMRSYLRYFMEAFRLPVMSRERIVSGMYVAGEEQTALAYLRAGRGVVFAIPHSGNIDVAAAWIMTRGAGPVSTVAERLKPESLFEQFMAFRESLGIEVVPLTGGPRPFGIMAERLRAGQLVCLIADRDLSKGGVEVDFFGEKARVAAGPAALAVQTGSVLMPVTLWFEGEGWRGHIYPEIPVPERGSPEEKVAAMTQQVAAVWAVSIAQHPEDWHMLQKVFAADLDAARLPAPQPAAPPIPA